MSMLPAPMPVMIERVAFMLLIEPVSVLLAWSGRFSVEVQTQSSKLQKLKFVASLH